MSNLNQQSELSVTPSIIGDGNVLLDVTVKNDSVKSNAGADPSINTMQIEQLLIADGDIVVMAE